MEEKKSKKGLVIVLIIIIIGLVCFILYDKNIIRLPEKKENKTTKVEKINKKLDVRDPQVLDLYEMVHSNICPGRVDDAITDEKLLVADMPIDYKFEILSNNYDYLASSEVSESDIKNVYEKVFGPGSYKRVDSFKLYVCGEYTFDEEKEAYVTDTEGCGCITSQGLKEAIIKAVQKDEFIKITTAVVFRGNFSNTIYFDKNEEHEIEGITGEWSDNSSDDITNYIEEHYNDLHQYMYTFKLNSDGNYYYYSVEKVK